MFGKDSYIRDKRGPVKDSTAKKFCGKDIQINYIQGVSKRALQL